MGTRYKFSLAGAGLTITVEMLLCNSAGLNDAANIAEVADKMTRKAQELRDKLKELDNFDTRQKASRERFIKQLGIEIR